MAIEWQKAERAGGVFVDWLAFVDGPDGTEIAADYGPTVGNRIAYQVAWRRKMTGHEAVTSQLTVQVAVEGYAPTLEVAKATCERLMESMRQIAGGSPGMLQTLHQVAAQNGN